MVVRGLLAKLRAFLQKYPLLYIHKRIRAFKPCYSKVVSQLEASPIYERLDVEEELIHLLGGAGNLCIFCLRLCLGLEHSFNRGFGFLQKWQLVSFADGPERNRHQILDFPETATSHRGNCSVLPGPHVCCRSP